MKNVTVRVGNLFDSKAQTLVNTVNCVGVMGKGIALEFKKRFPEMFEDYARRCEAGQMRLGQPYLFKGKTRPWILNFPTKGHWRAVARLSDIERGLEYLLSRYKSWGIESLAVPPLGCGQGQLEWRVVGPTLHRHLDRMDISVELYAPHGTPHEELTPQFLQGELFETENQPPQAQWIQPAWVALVEILARLESQPYHPPVGRIFFQKIAYVATGKGLPTGLRFERGSYGPFASGLKSLTARLLNNGLLREEQLGKMFHVRVGRTYTDARRAYEAALKEWEPVIAEVTDLFMRMDTKQAEIAATVLFSAAELAVGERGDLTERDVLEHAMQWKQKRRPPLDKQGLALAVRNLAALGWLNVRASGDLPIPAAEVLGV